MTRQVSWCALLIVAVVGLPKAAVAQSQPLQAGVVDALQQLTAEVAQLREAVKPRRFYMTTERFDGGHALTACAAGFHMASLWEIFDVTSLKYDTTLGYTAADSGQGPPTGFPLGWIRTGNSSKVSGETSDPNNCAAWTTSDPGSYGTMVALGGLWRSGLRPAPPEGTDSVESYSVPWVSYTDVCGFRAPVWCVQDR